MLTGLENDGLSALKRQCCQPGLTVMQNKIMRYRFAGAIALMALILTITLMAAPKSAPQEVTDGYGRDYLVLNLETD
jgi:hypothetical protein